ncbi:hypothetical protein [Paraburkholderia fynbosensis]|uniref:Uncharacterized protein n=1 Tax=Paraburkholderia fynbosensis TaxID=1200993 RepID=A0A6J5FK58_9BURK|nr:hypothetical protein [Paraburkholderia fynbosensis]CAB3782164.1 hypothetical protein LMG27177_01181 [Paraburkholderia fynbosensis]
MTSAIERENQCKKTIKERLLKIIVEHPGSTSAELVCLFGEAIKPRKVLDSHIKKGLVRAEQVADERRGWLNIYIAAEELVERIDETNAFRADLRWTKARRDELTNRFPHETSEALARAFSTTVRAINTMAHRLGLPRTGRPMRVRKDAHLRKSWSDAETIELVRRYPNEHNETLARAFGVTRRNLERRAAALKLRKAFGFTSYPTELQEVIKLNNRLKREIHERHKKTP